MLLYDLFESTERRLVVVYPGRFQPLHLGHAEVFRELQGKFGTENVFVGINTTPRKKEDPDNPKYFNGSQTIALINAAGIPSDHIKDISESGTTYMYSSMWKNAFPFDAKNTVLILAVGEPDAHNLELDSTYSEFTKSGKPAKIPPGKVAGDEKPLKSFKNFDECVTADQHTYVYVVSEKPKTIVIKGQEHDVSHGTECRNLWLQIRRDPRARKEFLTQLYGKNASNDIAHIFDQIPDQTVNEQTPKKRPRKLPKPLEPVGGFDKSVKKIINKGR